MLDPRPVGYVIGLLVAALGAAMLLPLALDVIEGRSHWPAFLNSAAITILVGGAVAISCEGNRGALSIRQIFLLTSGIWMVLPIFGALPFVMGATEARYVDAYFEAMSGLTTTGSTVLSNLDALPDGLKLWRGILQWLGGIGIIVVALVFLPELGTGGMRLFKSEGFDTDGKILPKAGQIAAQLAYIYVGITLACTMIYEALGMSGLDALVHAMTTVATGGFASYDSSFGEFSAAIQYVAVAFMVLAALPFVRFVQAIGGAPAEILRDPQVRGFLATLAVFAGLIMLWLWQRGGFTEASFRAALFNTTSLMTGTGYASEDYGAWGSFPVTMLYFVGLVGGCAGSTSCSIKIFRYQLLFSSLRAQIQRIHSPNGLFAPRYAGKPVAEDILSSVMAFFVLFVLLLGVLAVLLAMTGLDFITAVSGATTALANVGPGFGPEIGPSGNFAGLNDTAKWLLSAAMLLGRLELMAVLVLFTVNFWRG